MIQKTKAIVSKQIRASARSEDCTFQIRGVCNQDPETTVLCHLPDESHGMARKSDDISAAYGCDACHAAIDGRAPYPFAAGERDWYMRRAQTRTLRRLIEKRIVRVAA
ncbi:nuclease domain-containing protein [Crenobacter cavernae]|uniref:DUF1364 family protein n=1 Tax=Crenobacter cavernae TaxID=2290923 RepID=A0ABY0FD21_9NEIS|nr:nuclease domain-containing protein [Crenobacter cavernae]RXZ42689.1 DUF1364 family protein [Crenobacter cavernae]